MHKKMLRTENHSAVDMQNHSTSCWGLKHRTLPRPLLSDSTSRRSAISAILLTFSGFLLSLDVLTDDRIYCQLKHLMYARHLFTAAFDVHCSHLPRNALSLLFCDRRKTLGLEKINTGTFCAKVGLESNEDERSGGAKVEHFGIPLCIISL